MKTLSKPYNIVTTNNLKIARILAKLILFFMDYLINYKYSLLLIQSLELNVL